MNIFYALLLGIFTIVQLNCENLFDAEHDSLKNDVEFLPESYHHWTHYRYWRKLTNISQELIACGGEGVKWTQPDLIALCEVENDSVLTDLTKKSLLRNARYEYVMTNSPDERGIDVALLYSPFSFRLITSYPIRIDLLPDMKPTRDILYASGEIITGDTLHVFVVHAPSRSGGAKLSEPYRVQVAGQLAASIDSIRLLRREAKIVVAGDFNDYSNNKSLQTICNHEMVDISVKAQGRHGAKATYKFRGEWNSLDHILVSRSLARKRWDCYVVDYPFLLTHDDKYGGVMPLRNFTMYKYNEGYSDHLPLVAQIDI
ncbi:endonuclease/exonuclease/phosphatase family protein [Prevotella sp.]|uniref:endonuclease/exonuclease/phosphatase family protein n=1 Tax=Prevotella sp. TaxID=59823 RepID=UPI002F92F107